MEEEEEISFCGIMKSFAIMNARGDSYRGGGGGVQRRYYAAAAATMLPPASKGAPSTVVRVEPYLNGITLNGRMWMGGLGIPY